MPGKFFVLICKGNYTIMDLYVNMRREIVINGDCPLCGYEGVCKYLFISLISVSFVNGFSRNDTFPSAWKH